MFKAFCINLDARRDRWDQCLINHSRAGVPAGFIQRMPAVCEPEFGSLGQLKSHVKLLSQFLSEHTSSFCMVLEDDFDFCLHFHDLISRLGKILSSKVDWDVMLLAGTKVIAFPSNDVVARVVEAQATSGYLVNRRYVPTLLHCFASSIPVMEELKAPNLREYVAARFAADQVWKRLQARDKWFIFSPAIGSQRPSCSDIRGLSVESRNDQLDVPSTGLGNTTPGIKQEPNYPSKNKIRIYDTQFAHATSLGCGDLRIEPNNFVWTRQDDSDSPHLAVVSGSCFGLVDQILAQRKVGLIIEPPSIDLRPYLMAKDPHFRRKFEFIFTYSRKMLEMDPERFRFYPFMGCWIRPRERSVYPKSRQVSIVVSEKKITEAHRMRHAIVERFRGQIDVFGRGYKPIENKLEALKDYQFQIVVENEVSDYWFTEKICDCFATGTIPVYFGCRSIGDFFNPSGIIHFETLDDLKEILDQCNSALYEKKLDAVQDNFNRGREHGFLPDNVMYTELRGLIGEK